jgi:Protein of unknown function (DUF3048) N-terminal domain/Protein of unknown function (DUF3048) C-terminal domain
VKRTTTAGVVGAVAVGAALFALVATSIGGQAATPSGSPIAQATQPAATTTQQPTATPSATATASPTPSPSPTPIPTPVTVPAPLTGEPVSAAVAARHPIAVMIDDLRAARPQSGLSSASVVWQAPAEGGIPRYMAIFQDTMPKSIGPVRSSRYYYITWAAEWRAIYAHSGGSPGAKATLQAKGSGQYVYNIDEFRYSGTFFRIKTRSSPHNLYTTSAKLRATGKHIGAKDKAYKPVWNFAPDAPLDERPYGGSITVKYPYNTISYKYDRKTNTYLRSVTGETKQTDAGTGTRIAPKNVVVMRMRFGPLNDGHPGAPRLEAAVVGSGPAWISTNGRTIKGTWKKASVTKPTQFFDAQGNEVTLTIGQTFVQVVTTSTVGYPISFKAGSDTPPATPVPSTSPAN